VDEGEEDRVPFLLPSITKMPEAIFALMTAANSCYKLHHSHTVGAEYYANICDCGANFGDFYLFSEPGHAFFPMSVEEAAKTVITRLPLKGTFEICCAWEMSGMDFIFKHGVRH
jgi:hypothetical protein